MKSQYSYIVIIFTAWSIFLSSCGSSSNLITNNQDKKNTTTQQNSSQKSDDEKNTTEKNTTNNNTETIHLDKNSLIIDTTLYLNDYHIIIGKEKTDPVSKEDYSKDDLEFNSILIYFTKRTNDSVVLKKRFDENWFARITSFPTLNTQYFTLITFGGGSGYIANIYKVDFTPEPTFLEVASYHELSSVLFSKDGSELLIMNGIWDMSDETDESHFSDHRYEINTVDLKNNKFHRTTIGVTNNKYSPMDEDFTSEKLLNQIYQSEPTVFKGLDLDKYSF